jgi:hypothetical protein
LAENPSRKSYMEIAIRYESPPFSAVLAEQKQGQ